MMIISILIYSISKCVFSELHQNILFEILIENIYFPLNFLWYFLIIFIYLLYLLNFPLPIFH